MEKTTNNSLNTSNNVDLVNDKFKDKNFKLSSLYYLFFVASIIVVIGACVALVLQHNYENSTKNEIQWKLPTLICNIIALIFVAIYFFLQLKVIAPKQYHVKKKWFYIFLAAMISFCTMLVVSIFVIYISTSNNISTHKKLVIANLVIVGVWSLINTGLCRYSLFHIEKDIFMRQHGIDVQNQIKEKKNHDLNREKIDKLSDDEFKKLKIKNDEINDHSQIDKPTTGLADKAEIF